MKKLFNVFILIIFLTLILSVSCTQKEEDPVSPNLPNSETLMINFEEFTDTASMKSADNWLNAKNSLQIWEENIEEKMMLALAAYDESFDHAPNYLGNFEWLRSYQFMYNDETLKANLYSKKVNTSSEWEMYISKEGDYTNFLCFKATLNSLQTQASWSINKSPYDTVLTEILRIEYEKNAANGNRTISYYQAEEEIPDSLQSYIQYQKTAGTDYNRYFELFTTASEGVLENTSNIRWHSTLRNGGIKDYSIYGNTNFHCWDEFFMDTACP